MKQIHVNAQNIFIGFKEYYIKFFSYNISISKRCNYKGFLRNVGEMQKIDLTKNKNYCLPKMRGCPLTEVVGTLKLQNF